MTRERIVHTITHIAHGFTHLEQPFHMTYLGLVYVEGHSMYAFAAGGLFIIVAVTYLGELIHLLSGE